MPIAGKTGTAQDAGQEGSKDDSLFAAYGPTGGPGTAQWAVGTVIEDAGFGAWAAAPVVKCIFAALGDPSRMAPLVQSDPLGQDGDHADLRRRHAQLELPEHQRRQGPGRLMALLAPAPSLSLSRRSDVSARRLDWSILFTVAGLCAIGLTTIYSATGPTRRLSGLDPYYFVQRQGIFMGWRARRDGARRGHRLPAPAGVGAVLLRGDHRAAARRHHPGAGPQRRPGVVRHRTVPAATVGAGQGHAHPRAGLLRGQRSGRGPPLPGLRPRPRPHGRAPADRDRPARPRDGVGLRRHHHGRAPRGQGQPPPHRPRDRAGPVLGRPGRRHRHAAELPVRRA